MHTMSVTVTGLTGQVTYQWRKNGAIINGATLASLTLGPLSLADEGAYYCAVNDQSKALFESARAYIQVFAVGSLPVAGLAGLTLLAAACAIAGAARLRRKG